MKGNSRKAMPRQRFDQFGDIAFAITENNRILDGFMAQNIAQNLAFFSGVSPDQMLGNRIGCCRWWCHFDDLWIHHKFGTKLLNIIRQCC